MATLTLTIPNPQVARIQDAICIPQHGYTGFLDDGITVQSKSDFLKIWVGKQIKNAVKNHEAIEAAELAQITAINDIENNLIIT